mmetsp:Transcript_11875/g.27501  ORF Transcript_11875/g.27501 Transcript_11875/m.27501 type:complete len:212 (+) Transcript_11875:46-681(+)
MLRAKKDKMYMILFWLFSDLGDLVFFFSQFVAWWWWFLHNACRGIRHDEGRGRDRGCGSRLLFRGRHNRIDGFHHTFHLDIGRIHDGSRGRDCLIGGGCSSSGNLICNFLGTVNQDRRTWIWRWWGHLGFLLRGGGFEKYLGMILDLPVSVLLPVETTLFSTGVHPSVFFPHLDVDAELPGHRDPIHLLVMFLGDGIVLCPKILGMRYNLM